MLRMLCPTLYGDNERACIQGKSAGVARRKKECQCTGPQGHQGCVCTMCMYCLCAQRPIRLGSIHARPAGARGQHKGVAAAGPVAALHRRARPAQAG